MSLGRHGTSTLPSRGFWATAWNIGAATSVGGLALSFLRTMLQSSASTVAVVASHRGSTYYTASIQNEDDHRIVKVYIYDDPVFDNTDLVDCYRNITGFVPWLHEETDMAQNTGEMWMHRVLLEHPWRVLDPEEADVFFVPLYPFLSFHLLTDPRREECAASPHWERMGAAIMHLSRKSTYFKRFGGADHIVVCTWWNCRQAFGRWHRMILRRVILGITEGVDYWAEWGCTGRNVTIPYVASSGITSTYIFGGSRNMQRTIPFTFIGTTRRRPERQNLEVVMELLPDSVIKDQSNGRVWVEDSMSYANHMTRSRFCFCPRGDTMSSRRYFDSVAAGCIPIITSDEAEVLPFSGSGLNYSTFTVIAPPGSFAARDVVASLVTQLVAKSDEELNTLRQRLDESTASLIYGTTAGPLWSDMNPFQDVGSRFLVEVSRPVMDHMWSCHRQEVHTRPVKKQHFANIYGPLKRTHAELPPPEEMRKLWLSESEAILFREHSILVCAPPNTGSLQFRMLAKRVKGVSHWAISDDKALLFDPVASRLDLLDTRDRELMDSVFSDVSSAWITISLARDPVTRFLSAFLDLLHMSQRSYQIAPQDEIAWFIGAKGGVTSSQGGGDPGKKPTYSSDLATASPRRKHTTSRAGRRSTSDDSDFVEERTSTRDDFPSIMEVVATLEAKMPDAPLSFRPISTMCGVGLVAYDTIIPFETLQETSTRVLKSLPGGLWKTYGTSGWGPDGNQSFMEYDYGGIDRYHRVGNEFGWKSHAEKDSLPRNPRGSPTKTKLASASLVSSRPARYLYENESCLWTRLFEDEQLLRRAADLYATDYERFRWYDVEDWVKKFRVCRQRHL